MLPRSPRPRGAPGPSPRRLSRALGRAQRDEGRAEQESGTAPAPASPYAERPARAGPGRPEGSEAALRGARPARAGRGHPEESEAALRGARPARAGRGRPEGSEGGARGASARGGAPDVAAAPLPW